MRLREIREQRNMSMKELADAVGVSIACICRYERGSREPNIQTMKALATSLGTTVDELIGGTDDEAADC